MYTRSQIRTFRRRNIARLASLGDGDTEKARRLYNRLVRFSLRWCRWATVDCSENLTGLALAKHQHEHKLLSRLGSKLNDELAEYRLGISYNGLFPGIDGECIELIWY